MSNFITTLVCNNCNKEYNNIFISFGNNKYCFDYNWICENCNKESIRHIHGMMIPGTRCEYHPKENKKPMWYCNVCGKAIEHGNFWCDSCFEVQRKYDERLKTEEEKYRKILNQIHEEIKTEALGKIKKEENKQI